MAKAPAKTPELQQWLTKISTYEKTFKKWEGRTEKILKRYRDESRPETTRTSRFNILWSNVQTAMPAVFARLPKPDVSRRFRDNDPVGRVAALILERSLEFEVEHYPDYRGAMEGSVFDRFLGGRGISWVRLENGPGLADVQITDDANAEEPEEEQIEEGFEYQCAPCDYVHWKDFGHTQARCWEEVTAVWRRVYMQRPALVKRFGEEIGNEIPLDTSPEKPDRTQSQDGIEQEACIYEIWDKASGTAIWLSKSWHELLDQKEDPLKLQNFFPCPKPLYATLTTDSLVPVPDFALYQDQANTLDLLCERIDGLIIQLQVKGVHDAAVPELQRLFTEGGNGDLIPVQNFAAFAEKNGLMGAISLVDLTPIFNALTACYTAMEQQKAQVYEITGLSDIVRGQTDSAETATAQQLKGQYASMRLKAMQNAVSQYAAELLQLKAQIICRFFTPDTIAKIASVQQLNEADQQYIGPAIQLLKSEVMSDFRIEVSADSLVMMDEQAEKQSAVELIGALGKFISDAQNAPPDAVPFLGEMLKWGMARFKGGKSLEGALDQFVDQAKEKAKQPPQPSPEQIKAQAEQQKQQMEAQRAQMDMQAEAQRQQAETVRMQQEAQMEGMRMQIEQQQAQAEQAREDARLQLEQMRMQMEAQSAERDRQLQIVLQKMKDENALEQAQISSATTLQAAQESAAEKASENEGA